MKGKVTPQWILGVLTGAILPILGVMLVLDARPELLGIQRFEEYDVVKQVNVQIVTFGMIVNAAIFFLALRFHKEELSRGILFVSVIYLIIIFVYRFLL